MRKIMNKTLLKRIKKEKLLLKLNNKSEFGKQDYIIPYTKKENTS